MDSTPRDHLRFRPDTMDRAIFDSVNSGNEYRLPPLFESSDVLMDVGGHIGSFSFAALSRGAGKVYTFEAEASNFELVKNNLAPFGARSVVRRAAVFRSDRDIPTLTFTPSSDQANTGGGGFWQGESSQTVPVAKFDDLVDEATQLGRRRIRLLKMDCEGSEWPILLTSRRLDLIDAICGEYHIADYGGPMRVEGFGKYCTDLLRDFLTAQGFDVELDPTKLPCGLFFGRREGAIEFTAAETGYRCYQSVSLWRTCKKLWSLGNRSRQAA
ncbi:MAG: FkbM family methyltransferase [Planctomycetes bacterium]|nr:FkbM family methyltransferase [Planctomycetota bacterium]